MEQEPKITPDWIKEPEEPNRFAEDEPGEITESEEALREPVTIGEYRAREPERNSGAEASREPDRFAESEASDFGGICDLVLRGIGIGMGVAVTVLSTLNAIQAGTAFIMLGVGLTAVAISVMKKM
jgi:hypothetical protein